ncbi:MAG: hypothetical protein Q7T44_15085 [Parvibaculum sp.]|nr:hypothetical protein [Parvibaculum sp.]
MNKRLICGLAALLFAAPAYANTVDSTYGNTLIATDAQGTSSAWFIEPDSTYKITLADGSKVGGVWSIADDKFCTEQNSPAAAPKACFDYVQGKNVGDSWSVKSASGEALTISIKAGR